MLAEGPGEDLPAAFFFCDRKGLVRGWEGWFDGDGVVGSAVIERHMLWAAEPFVGVGVEVDQALAVDRNPRLLHRPPRRQRPEREFFKMVV